MNGAMILMKPLKGLTKFINYLYSTNLQRLTQKIKNKFRFNNYLI